MAQWHLHWSHSVAQLLAGMLEWQARSEPDALVLAIAKQVLPQRRTAYATHTLERTALSLAQTTATPSGTRIENKPSILMRAG